MRVVVGGFPIFGSLQFFPFLFGGEFINGRRKRSLHLGVWGGQEGVFFFFFLN